MKTLRMGDYTLTSWAEKLDGHWQGLASVSPRIPNSWWGGPQGDSLFCDGVHASAQIAESAALDEAVRALNKYLKSQRS